jgi:hypothetical protein
MAFKFAQLQKFTLAGSGAVIGATSITLTSMLDIDGNTITMAGAFGDLGFGTIDPNAGELEEQISFTGLTNNANGTVTLTGVKTVLFLSPYTQTSGLAKTHAGGATFVISNTSGFYNRIATDVTAGVWQAWTPTLSGGWLSAGNATFDCRYFQQGKLVVAQVVIINGTTTTYQAGTMTFTLPVASTSSDVAFIGPVYMQDTGIASYMGSFIRFNTTTAGMNVGAVDPTALADVYVKTALVTNTLPFTWASTDCIRGTLMYEAA